MNHIKEKTKTKRCRVIGASVEKHSLSPGMHRIIYNELDLTDWEYGARNILNEEELKEFVDEVKRKNYKGFNVTVPYKEVIRKYIDQEFPSVKRVGAVNTVLNDNGRLVGYNTDFTGFKKDLEETLGFNADGKKVLVIGAGGAGKAVLTALSWKFMREDTNAMNIDEIYIYDVDIEKCENVKKDFEERFINVIYNKEELYKGLREIDLLVNSSPVGMNEAEAVIKLESNNIKKNLMVYDVVYNRKTELLRDAEKLGLQCAGGIGMLARQGAKAFEIWSGREHIIDENIIDKMKEYLRKEVCKND